MQKTWNQSDNYRWRYRLTNRGYFYRIVNEKKVSGKSKMSTLKECSVCKRTAHMYLVFNRYIAYVPFSLGLLVLNFHFIQGVCGVSCSWTQKRFHFYTRYS